jgi:hypothetical protein
MIQKTLFVVVMLVAAAVMGFAAHRLGSVQPRPIPDIYMIYNLETGDVEQTRDERVVERCLRNRRLRVFTFTPGAQFLEISFGRTRSKRGT